MRISFPKLLLHLEALAVLALALSILWAMHTSWLLFIIILILPDAGLLGYLINKNIGSITYNILHTYTLPLLLFLFSILLNFDIATQVALIWASHIAIDRALGLGLKYPLSFKLTHMQKV